MGRNRKLASYMVKELAKDNIAFKHFVEDNIEMLLRSDRSFIICSKEGIPQTMFKKDEGGIWVALISELQGI